MEEFLLENEREIYSVAFFGTLAIVALWEGLRPRRQGTQPLRTRWAGNFGLALINVLLIHFSLPVVAVAFSILVAENGYGLFPVIGLTGWLAIPFGILAIDLGRWVQHFLLHRIPLLWRLHRIHHADHDYDFTVGFRFHPIEALCTAAFVFPVILLFGPPPVAVAVVEICAAVSGLIVHANAGVGERADRYLRFIFVTPDMHRIHHSIDERENNSNFAAVFSFWDRLFGIYIGRPAAGQVGMTIGLPDLRNPRCLKLGWMLAAPFRQMPHLEPKPKAGLPITPVKPVE